MIKEKRCCHCHEVKDINEFWKNKSKQDGHTEYCRTCGKSYRPLWRRDPILSRLYRTTPQYKYYTIKYRADEDNIPITFTQPEFSNWFNAQEKICHYCNIELEPSANKNLRSLSIDRKDNSQGYTLQNITLSCWRCNVMKGSWLTEQQTIEIARKYFM